MEVERVELGGYYLVLAFVETSVSASSPRASILFGNPGVYLANEVSLGCRFFALVKVV